MVSKVRESNTDEGKKIIFSTPLQGVPGAHKFSCKMGTGDI